MKCHVLLLLVCMPEAYFSFLTLIIIVIIKKYCWSKVPKVPKVRTSLSFYLIKYKYTHFLDKKGDKANIEVRTHTADIVREEKNIPPKMIHELKNRMFLPDHRLSKKMFWSVIEERKSDDPAAQEIWDKHFGLTTYKKSHSR